MGYKQIVVGHLGPLQSQIQGLHGCVDSEGLLSQGLVMLTSLPIDFLWITCQFLVDGLDRLPITRPASHHDRDEAAYHGYRLLNPDLKLVRLIGEHVGGCIRNASSRRRAHVTMILAGWFGNQIRVLI